MSWAAQDFVSIYLYYSASAKNLFVNRSSEDHMPLFKKLSFAQFNTLVENLVTLLFDNRLFPMHYLKTLEDLKALLENIKKEVDTNGTANFFLDLIKPSDNSTQKYEVYLNFLTRLLHKVIMLLKNTRDQVQELMKFLATCEPSHYSEKEPSKSADDLLFKDLPRFEECPTEEILQSKIMNYINKSEHVVNDDSTYYYHINQRTKPSPLLEDKESLILNSLIFNSKHRAQIQNFIEENIYKKIHILNEISSLLFLEMVNITFNPSMLPLRSSYYTHDQAIYPMHVQPKQYVYQLYSEKELYYLKQLYKLNLEIFMALNQDTKNLKDNVEMLKFDCRLFERFDKERDIRMDQRQLYMLFNENLPLILSILKNFVRNVDIYPQLFYVFFDCFCGTDFLQQVINYDTRQNPAANQPGGQTEKFTGLYTLSLLSKLFIKHLMVMFNKLPEKLDQFHFLYDKDINIHYFFLKILKFIFRTIKLKEESSKAYAAELINLLKKHIFKLIMVALKLSSKLCVTSHEPVSYGLPFFAEDHFQKCH